MKRTGNTASNRVYNPHNKRPDIPIDVDEVAGVMERYIRQKYDTRILSSASQSGSSTHNTGSTNSTMEDRSQELPPKPSKRFTLSFRSTSATHSLSRPSKGASGPGHPSHPNSDRAARMSPKKNKPAKIFGADIGGSRQDNYELKLIALREMGFPDDKHNFTILKGENGNIEGGPSLGDLNDQMDWTPSRQP